MCGFELGKAGTRDWTSIKRPVYNIKGLFTWRRGPQVGEVTRLGGVKNNRPLYAILQLRHPGVHFLKINEWSLST